LAQVLLKKLLWLHIPQLRQELIKRSIVTIATIIVAGVPIKIGTVIPGTASQDTKNPQDLEFPGYLPGFG
jgi:hypothetical protein